GSHTLRLENLDTSNGPDLRVLITDAPVQEGPAGRYGNTSHSGVTFGRGGRSPAVRKIIIVPQDGPCD
ncbi:hypothetical protein ACIPUC_02430, partial [Streptomyces sp. LARHCF249]